MAVTPYRTRQRELIWNYLCAHSGEHIGAQEIAARLRAEGVGEATVYRYLDRLVADGLVRRFYAGEGRSACYQLAAGGDECREHFHLQCLRCGRLYHVECERLGEIHRHICEEHRFLIDSSKTVFYGVCGACAAKENAEYPPAVPAKETGGTPPAVPGPNCREEKNTEET